MLLGPVAINTGTGSQTINTNLPTLRYSNFTRLRATLSITKALEDAADTCDVYLQSLAQDGLTWNDRIHFGQITGSDTPAATTPEVRIANLLADIPLESTEEHYESTGSVGGSSLAAGAVRNGPLPALYRTAAGPQPNMRVSVVVVDADADADFEGSLWLELD